MEAIPTPDSKSAEFEAFSKRLIELGLADEVIPGDKISTTDFVAPEDGNQTVEFFVQAAVRFLSAPTIIDHFESHEQDRLPAYNASGIFHEFNTDWYMNNRLRLNKVRGLLSTLKVISTHRRLPTAFTQQAQAVLDAHSTEAYNSLGNEKRLAFTLSLADGVKTVLSAAIKSGVISYK